MLWEQQSTARKPPKKSVLLLFSVSNLFHLAKSFIVCTSPDYIIDTIGSTNRDGIERAYDWLIPIISSLPSVINRLPSSASCFLLLRAYGEGGGSNTGELLKLSSPLLTHVQKSLFGEHEAIGTKRASDLLFFDIADQDQDRRNCARRVLSEALGKIEVPEHTYPTSLKGEYIWLVTLLQTKYSDVIVKSVVPQLVSEMQIHIVCKRPNMFLPLMISILNRHPHCFRKEAMCSMHTYTLFTITKTSASKGMMKMDQRVRISHPLYLDS